MYSGFVGGPLLETTLLQQPGLRVGVTPVRILEIYTKTGVYEYEDMDLPATAAPVEVYWYI